ncbi:hypothetical protein K438DRAFT_1774788 [Mycena galopus ATCC 62051]|nr:hypothetical protein K438DRAFT_1774788 [Mycena galopus ATCC 62051]
MVISYAYRRRAGNCWMAYNPGASNVLIQRSPGEKGMTVPAVGFVGRARSTTCVRNLISRPATFPDEAVAAELSDYGGLEALAGIKSEEGLFEMYGSAASERMGVPKCHIMIVSCDITPSVAVGKEIETSCTHLNLGNVRDVCQFRGNKGVWNLCYIYQRNGCQVRRSLPPVSVCNSHLTVPRQRDTMCYSFPIGLSKVEIMGISTSPQILGISVVPVRT